MKGNKLLGGLLAGAVIGAIAGLLLAPKSGKETREIVKVRAGEIRQKVGGYWGTLRRRRQVEGIGEGAEDTSDHHVGASVN